MDNPYYFKGIIKRAGTAFLLILGPDIHRALRGFYLFIILLNA